MLLLARGMSNAEIADELHLAEGTVKTHMGRIFSKWQLRDRVQVLLHALRAGVVSVRDLPISADDASRREPRPPAPR